MINDPSTISAGLVGVVLPFLISLLLSPSASPRFKAIFTFLMCLLFTIVATVITYQIKPGTEVQTPAQLVQLSVQNLAACFILAVVTYQGLTRPTGLASKLEHTGGKAGEQD